MAKPRRKPSLDGPAQSHPPGELAPFPQLCDIAQMRGWGVSVGLDDNGAWWLELRRHDGDLLTRVRMPAVAAPEVFRALATEACAQLGRQGEPI
jgi:hypothetical protein